MAVSLYKTFIDGEPLTANDLNASLLQFVNGGVALVSPLTGTLDANGNEIIFDADADSSITADTDDVFDFKAGGVDIFKVDGSTASSVNGLTVLSAATGNKAQLKAHGSDTNIGITILPKGTGAILLDADPTGTGVDIDGAPLVLDADGDSSLRETSDDVLALKLQNIDAFIFDGDAASAADGFTFRSAATGTSPEIAAQGSSTNIDVKLTPKGSGVVKLGSATVTATPAAGAVPIADGSGKLANGWISASSVDQHTDITLLAVYTPSGASSVDITSVITSTYAVYVIYYEVKPSSGPADLMLRGDSDNGASFTTTASYQWGSGAFRLSSAASNSSTSTYLQLANQINLNGGFIGRIDLLNTLVSVSGQPPIALWHSGYVTNGAGYTCNIGAGYFVDGTINAVQLASTTGTLTGSVRVYGLKAT